MVVSLLVVLVVLKLVASGSATVVVTVDDVKTATEPLSPFILFFPPQSHNRAMTTTATRKTNNSNVNLFCFDLKLSRLLLFFVVLLFHFVFVAYYLHSINLSSLNKKMFFSSHFTLNATFNAISFYNQTLFIWISLFKKNYDVRVLGFGLPMIRRREEKKDKMMLSKWFWVECQFVGSISCQSLW